jgi:hypothetical protein
MIDTTMQSIGVGGIFALLVINTVRQWRAEETAKKNGNGRLAHVEVSKRLEDLKGMGQGFVFKHQALAKTMSNLEMYMREIRDDTRATKAILHRMERNGKR